MGAADEFRQNAAVARAFGQNRIAVVIRGRDLRVVQSHLSSEMLGGLTIPVGSELDELMTPEDAREVERRLREVLDTGRPFTDWRRSVRPRRFPEQEWDVSVSAFPLDGADGRPAGVAVVFIDLTEQRRARQRLDLLYRAAADIGASLDVTRTTQDLVDVLVPAFADHAAVSLAEAVLAGDEPPQGARVDTRHYRRVSVSKGWPGHMLQPGDALPATPLQPGIDAGRVLLVSGRARITQTLGDDPALVRLMVPGDAHSLLIAPLYARGRVLGGVNVWRTGRSEPFDAEDARLLEEIVSRAALSVDNARRYTREHSAAVTLQRSLLPQVPAELSAAMTAGTYLPAGGGAGVGGDWFDVIPLSSLRVAFVVGDVAGHGLHASATMGRLRTAVQTLADLDLPPDELLAHLDDLVLRLEEERGAGQENAVGATCLYATYDPVTRRCAVASAGHPPPLLLRPGEPAAFVELSPGPPLGVGGMPFEPTEIVLPEGSVLALYTDGLVEGDDHDFDDGMGRLRRRLEVLCRPGRAVADISRDLLAEFAGAPPADDIALLLARTRVVPARDTASWEFAADPSVVAEARKAAGERLAAWDLGEMASVTELVVSELVTNAIRYGGAPVGLRLIRDGGTLICEVSDPSSTQPRLRRARDTDEGGRGLFLVAQLSTRWGSRYTHTGKTIWTEQPITGADPLSAEAGGGHAG
ncbi:serine phosphatase RsbU (regulator of sigma subunit)/anti-sigma regulatory factor (Ser/Thr protein kinase) [Thermocatellispora tengchongensis]|uniref:protein-serine/threonine phosphatase n=1 Tax=Thermocatellispora tengchongensis TaxID=1073253 RepID=A0A840PJ39_9ACTN|nr:SpoIIE family protein phosphatase [Thermocatellispora tengchongensis]MBB5137831.1 serine phosphatase RsbU (regulator of sigma subunit)/anti-sigma regulatory factor (Ser/Thr protein kinase) [Thermocatellispora tengchongensis]